MRAEHRRPFVAFFVVAALCALALGNTAGTDSTPEPFARTPEPAVVPRAAMTPVGFELLGETAAQLLVKRIRAAAAVDGTTGPATPDTPTTALAGVDVRAADRVAPDRSDVRSAQTRETRATRAGVRRPSRQPDPKPAPLTVARSPQPSTQPTHAAPEPTQTTRQSSGGTERASSTSTSSRPTHAGPGRTSHRTTPQPKSHARSHAEARGQSRAKSHGKARAKGHGKGHGKGKGRR